MMTFLSGNSKFSCLIMPVVKDSCAACWLSTNLSMLFFISLTSFEPIFAIAMKGRYQLRLSALGVRAIVTPNDSRAAFLQHVICCKDWTFERRAKSQRACD
jgi:hypothetical protein